MITYMTLTATIHTNYDGVNGTDSVNLAFLVNTTNRFEAKTLVYPYVRAHYNDVLATFDHVTFALVDGVAIEHDVVML